METEDTITYMYEVIKVTLPPAYSSSTSTATAISTTSMYRDIDININIASISNSEVVLALYKTEEEVQECIVIKLYLMNKRMKKKESKGNDKMSSAWKWDRKGGRYVPPVQY